METLRQRSPARPDADVSHRGHICLASDGRLFTPTRSQHWQEEEVGSKTDHCRRCESHCWWRRAVSAHIMTKLIRNWERKKTSFAILNSPTETQISVKSRLFKTISWRHERQKSVLVFSLTLTPSGERGQLLSVWLHDPRLLTSGPRANFHKRASVVCSFALKVKKNFIFLMCHRFLTVNIVYGFSSERHNVWNHFWIHKSAKQFTATVNMGKESN